MVPFLHRCEGQKEGAAKSLLREYLVNLAQRDLTLPLIIFQHSKPDVSIWMHTSFWLFVPCQGRCRIPGAVKCYIYDPIRAEPRTALLAIRKHAAHTHKHTASMLMYEKGSVTPWYTHTRTYKQSHLSSLSVPAEDHRGPRPADVGRSGVHLQLWERRPAQPLLWHPGVSAAEGLRVRHAKNTHTNTQTYMFTHNVRELRLFKNL